MGYKTARGITSEHFNLAMCRTNRYYEWARYGSGWMRAWKWV